MSDSFASASFHSHDTGNGIKPQAFRAPLYTVTPIPGSPSNPAGANVLDSGGMGEGRLQVPCVEVASDIATLRGLLGTFGTLIYDGTTSTNVYFAGMTEIGRTITADKVFCTLEFVI